MILLIVALSVIGLVMAVFPRRLMEWMDRMEDRLFKRRPVKATASAANDTNTHASRMSSIIVLSTRVVGIFTVALGLFYIVMFVFVYPI